jgi:diaminopimelate decarboxylase
MVSSDLRRALKGTGAPTAVLDLDAFDANLDALAERARGLPIRLATKSLRVPAAIDRALAHPAFSGVLAYSVPEALFLQARGVRDIVIGYPSLDRQALSRMFAEVGACTNITLMIDSVDHLDIIDDVRENLAEAGAASPRREPPRCGCASTSIPRFGRLNPGWAIASTSGPGARRSGMPVQPSPWPGRWRLVPVSTSWG